MPPEERRRALIDVTLPLLLEQGTSVSTRQIAEAAGIAEGTIFRVFESKDDLVHACLHDALTTDTLAERLDALPAGTDLATTVTGVAGVLVERIARIRTLLALVHDRPQPAPSGTCGRPNPAVIRARVVGAVTAALSGHADELRVGVDAAASALVAVTFGATHTFSGDGDLADPAAITDLILHGIGKEA